MNRFIDTHAHIYDPTLLEDINSLIESAREVGVEHIYMPNVDEKSISPMLELEQRFPQTHAMMGIHPCSVTAEFKSELRWVEKNLNARPFAGVGEVGIDLYWEKKYFKEQFEAFSYQIDMARDLGYPVIIHSRESMEECIELVAEKQNGNLTGVFHCFTGSAEQAERIMDLGFYMGIGGVLTYKNSSLGDALVKVPLSSLVLETDSPYLPPVPHRGKKNKPEFLIHVAEKLAIVKGVELEEIARITTLNANKLFATHQSQI